MDVEKYLNSLTHEERCLLTLGEVHSKLYRSKNIDKVEIQRALEGILESTSKECSINIHSVALKLIGNLLISS